MHVLRPDEKLASLPKPLLQLTSQFSLDTDDCLVMCVGFEDRAVAVLRNALVTSSDFRVLIVHYLPFIVDNRLSEIKDLCHQGKLQVSEVTYDRQNPTGFGGALLEKVAGVRGRIFLDISGMSRLLIVQSLAALACREGGLKDCLVTYAEAAEYPPTTSEVERALKQADEDPIYTILLLSSGVFDVTVVPELSPTSIGGSQMRMVVFPTFSADQLTALINELGPSRLTLIHGIPPRPENKWRTDAIAKINRIDSIRIPRDEMCTSTLDYRETLSELLKLYSSYSERERLLISPTGSKMQAVAVGLFRAFIDDVQIVYPTPKEFCSPTNYTRGVIQLYSLSLNDFSVEKNTACVVDAQ